MNFLFHHKADHKAAMLCGEKLMSKTTFLYELFAIMDRIAYIPRGCTDSVGYIFVGNHRAQRLG